MNYAINLNYNNKINSNLREIKFTLKKFSSGEFHFELLENECLEKKDITIFQSFNRKNFNEDLLKIQMICDTLRINKVRKLTYFAPFLPYLRQDKTNIKKISLGSRILAKIINNSKINEVITYNPHSLQIKKFLNCNFKILDITVKFIKHIKENFTIEDVTIVFPDKGAQTRFKKEFKRNKFKTKTLQKERFKDKIEINNNFKIKTKIAIIIDDMIDSGNTIIKASEALRKNNINSIYVYAVHGIFSKNSIKLINNSKINKCFVTNSIKFTPSKNIEILEL